MSTGNNNNTGKVRRCLICRKPGQSLIKPVSLSLPEFQQDLNKLQNIWSQSCISSVCSLLNIQKSPFKHFITNATYCQDCQQLLRDIDLAQKQLKNFQQQLIGFQQDIYLKLGDNYDAVPSKDKLEANYKDLESPSKIYKRQFSYDEVVKMLYEKIDKEYHTLKEIVVKIPNSRSLIPLSKNKVCNDNVKKITSTSIGNRTFRLRENKDSKNAEGKTTELLDCDNNDEPLSDTADPDWNYSDVESVKSNGPNEPGIIPINKITICSVEGCTSVFKTENSLIIHRRQVHEGDPKPYHCDTCDMKYASAKGLSLHMGSHNLEPVLCTICGKRYKTESYLKQHVQKVHNKPQKCKICGLRFEEVSQLDEHEKTHLLNTDEPFRCVFCNEVFTNSSDLRMHVEKLHVENPNTCDVCHKRFAQRGGLLQHMKTHEESFVGHKCLECGFVFSNKRALERHMPKHTDEKNYKCSQCEEAFKYPNGLRLHIRRHNNDLKYVCQVCKKGFIASQFLKHHEQQKHSSILTYKCSQCDKAFKTKSGLYQHEQTHVPNRVVKKRYRNRPNHGISKPGSSSKRHSKMGSKRTKQSDNLEESSSDNSEDCNYSIEQDTKKSDHLDLQSAISSIVQVQDQQSLISEYPSSSTRQGYYNMPHLPSTSSIQSTSRHPDNSGRNNYLFPYTQVISQQSQIQYPPG